MYLKHVYVCVCVCKDLLLCMPPSLSSLLNNCCTEILIKTDSHRIAWIQHLHTCPPTLIRCHGSHHLSIIYYIWSYSSSKMIFECTCSSYVPHKMFETIWPNSGQTCMHILIHWKAHCYVFSPFPCKDELDSEHPLGGQGQPGPYVHGGSDWTVFIPDSSQTFNTQRTTQNKCCILPLKNFITFRKKKKFHPVKVN